jgi:hypothetical protein
MTPAPNCTGPQHDCIAENARCADVEINHVSRCSRVTQYLRLQERGQMAFQELAYRDRHSMP